MASIHVGIGGWNFPPWRGTFYPARLPQAHELEYASRRVTSIEINATFYGSQKPASFIKWREQTPEDFTFAVKGPRYATHRANLADAADSVARFVGSGVLELQDKLGPILWQFPSTRRFEPDALRTFLALLPGAQEGRTLRHVVEARHPSFADPAWMELLAEFGAAHAIVESDKHVLLGDLTTDFVYLRLERNSLQEPEGYGSALLDQWAGRVHGWMSGHGANDLPRARPHEARHAPRECFVYFISGDKVQAPRAAMAFLDRLAK